MVELNKLVEEMKATEKCTNLTILKFERQVHIVAAQTPHLFARCADQAIYIKALMIRDKIQVLWIVLNPMDIRSFLVLVLAGVEYKGSESNGTTETFTRVIVIINPVVVAHCFETICMRIFEYLLAAGSDCGGFLRPVSTYFRTVETNDQRMLHFQCLIVLRRAFHHSEMCDRLCLYLTYAKRMVEFIDNIIRCSIDSTLQIELLSHEAPNASLDETDKEFAPKLNRDSIFIVVKCQLHSSTHNTTYFKYSAAVTRQCQFYFLSPLVTCICVLDQGTIDI